MTNRERAERWIADRATKGFYSDTTTDSLTALLDDVRNEVIFMEWTDRKDEWTDAIKAAHPARSESHDEYATAMQMVGHRHSKGELVALVNWLLVKNRSLVDDIAEPFEVEQRCADCGTPMLPPVSLWRCEHEPSTHTAVGSEIAYEVRKVGKLSST
jgi:hypothetical protein